MPAVTKCSHCDPPGSGQCRDCQSVGSGRNAKCAMCYGTGWCSYCDGSGLAKSTFDKCKDILWWVWFVSWFGIIPSFFIFGVWTTWYISPQRRGTSGFSLTVMIVTGLLWVLFFAIDNKARDKVDGRKNKQVVGEITSVIGTVLAIFTLLGIFFFVYIAPRIQ